MAPTKTAKLDLNEMLATDRQRRKNEAIAKEIFGKNRRKSAPGASTNNTRKAASVPSLASRITSGISKRSASTSKPARPSTKPPAGNVDAEWTHDLHALNNPDATKASQLPPRGPKASRTNRNDRLFNALNGSASSPALNSQFSIVGSAKPTQGISIRGLAGPYIVIIKNLALGTSAADIESAMTPTGGLILSCRLIAERPKVIAELVFETKEGADNVVETFNNQNADGNLLHVYHKVGPIPASAKLPAQQPAVSPVPQPPTGPRADKVNDRSDDHSYGGSDRYTVRERSRERRRDVDTREEVMDGTYGFDDRMDTDDTAGKRYESGRGRGLYSDNLIANRGRGLGRDRGGRDRGRGYR